MFIKKKDLNKCMVYVYDINKLERYSTELFDKKNGSLIWNYLDELA